MTDKRLVWLVASLGVSSHRSMYTLATEIEGSDRASPELKAAATEVLQSLERVIDLAVASSRVLGRASRKFDKLVRVLEQKDSVTQPKFP
jgi:hypothetical protein